MLKPIFAGALLTLGGGALAQTETPPADPPPADAAASTPVDEQATAKEDPAQAGTSDAAATAIVTGSVGATP